MDAMTVLGWIVVAVLTVLGVELVHRRDRQVMRQAVVKLDAARRDVVAARDVLAGQRVR